MAGSTRTASGRFDRIEERLAPLGVGLLLHDIGKLAVPPEILRKPGPLTDEEWKAMRAHPTLGFQILRKDDEISPLARAVVRSHHERWNGSGYPDKQSGAQIHQFARIAAVADVFDALTSDRYYRKAMPIDEAYDFVAGRGGRDFDPEVVDLFRSFVAPYPPGTSRRALGRQLRPRQGGPSAGRRLPVVRIIMNASGELVAAARSICPVAGAHDRLDGVRASRHPFPRSARRFTSERREAGFSRPCHATTASRRAAVASGETRAPSRGPVARTPSPGPRPQ